MPKKAQPADPVPDLRPLTEIQANRLAALTGLNAKNLIGKNVAALRDTLRWQIDLELLLFRRICGRVVKRDPATGEEYPVPFATVHVEDTDCSLLGFFPGEWPWGWFFPFFCRREEVASVVTDACGRFCVWVPRWEVDYILRFRHERFCFPDIFLKPSVLDILEPLREPGIFRPPRPLPDPPPFFFSEDGLDLRRVENLLGAETARQLAAAEAGAAFGTSTGQKMALLQRNGFSRPFPPPLPPEFKPALESRSEGASSSKKSNGPAKFTMEHAKAKLADSLHLNAQILRELDFRNYLGPFRRCFDVITPEWVPIFDVPDVTFKVTQDVDADGDEEVIYSEGHFDVRWNSGAIPDVTLEASPIAVAGLSCEAPEVPCADVPAILFVGRQPVVNPPSPADPYHDAASGYARRPNRPHASGNLTPVDSDLPLELAESPYAKTLQLYGCNHVDGAEYYRLRYSRNGSPWAPFVGLTWPLWRYVGGLLQHHWPVSDGNGWYPILPDADDWFPAQLLLDWRTNRFPNGLYRIEMDLGNAAKAVIQTSPAVSFRIDNSDPLVEFTELKWRQVPGAWSAPVLLNCSVIPRPSSGGNPVDIELMLSYRVSAQHLRSVRLYAVGCGGDNPVLLSPLSTAQHWHTSPGDNSVVNTAIFSLAGTAQQGAYRFSIRAISRAFNPSGGDGGQLVDWNYDPIYNWVWPIQPFAVINV